MNLRATIAAVLLAAAPITCAQAQFDFRVSYSNYTAFGALVTVDVRNTQPSNASFLQVVSEFRLSVNADGCFVTGPCRWGPKTVSLVGPVGVAPIRDRDGNTYTQSVSSWFSDMAFGNILGFGTGFDNMGILGCVNPSYIPDIRSRFTQYTASTCAERGESGFVRFQTFLTTAREFGPGIDPRSITGDFVQVYAVNPQPVNLITPEPSTYALMGIGLAGIFAFRRRQRAG